MKQDVVRIDISMGRVLNSVFKGRVHDGEDQKAYSNTLESAANHHWFEIFLATCHSSFVIRPFIQSAFRQVLVAFMVRCFNYCLASIWGI